MGAARKVVEMPVAEPVELVEKYRPLTIAGFVGQEGPRALMGKLAANPYASNWMLIGASGLGKSTMALAAAEEIGGQLHKISSRQCNAAMVDRVVEKSQYMPMEAQQAFHIWLIDEAETMSRAAQLSWLSILDATGKLPGTIILFTANGSGEDSCGAPRTLDTRFLSRCKVVRFVEDRPALVGLLKRIWKLEAPKGMKPPDFELLALQAEGNNRTAIQNLELELAAPGTGIAANWKPSKKIELAWGRDGKTLVNGASSDAAVRAWGTIRTRYGSKGRRSAEEIAKTGAKR